MEHDGQLASHGLLHANPLVVKPAGRREVVRHYQEVFALSEVQA